MQLESEVIQAEGGVVVVALKGRLIAGPRLTIAEAQVKSIIKQGATRLVLDLAQVEHADSSGFCLILHAFTALSAVGGQLRIASTPSVGTTVELCLPAAIAPGTVSAAPGSKTALKGSGNILLVDDTVAVLRTTTVLLESAGFQVRQAGSGEQALALLVSGERFDALVSDYAMAGMNGVKLIGEARAHYPELPAVIITGFAEITDSEVLPKGVAVLRKPFGRTQLVKILLDALGNRAG